MVEKLAIEGGQLVAVEVDADALAWLRDHSWVDRIEAVLGDAADEDSRRRQPIVRSRAPLGKVGDNARAFLAAGTGGAIVQRLLPPGAAAGTRCLP